MVYSGETFLRVLEQGDKPNSRFDILYSYHSCQHSNYSQFVPMKYGRSRQIQVLWIAYLASQVELIQHQNLHLATSIKPNSDHMYIYIYIYTQTDTYTYLLHKIPVSCHRRGHLSTFPEAPGFNSTNTDKIRPDLLLLLLSHLYTANSISTSPTQLNSAGFGVWRTSNSVRTQNRIRIK